MTERTCFHMDAEPYSEGSEMGYCPTCGQQDVYLTFPATARMTPSEYALRLAETAALRSEDPKRRVGCALLRADNTVAALGYNGAPSGVELRREHWDGPDKSSLVIHAEVNALRYVRPGEAVLLASTYLPCVDCLKTAVAQGVKTIVYRDRPRVLDAEAGLALATAELFGVALHHKPRSR